MTGAVSRTGLRSARASAVLDQGLRQEAAFVGPDGSRIMVLTTLPAGRTRGSVVVCSSLHTEWPRNYRREVLLARALARRGIGVQRFQYRGTANSDGGSGVPTWGSLKEDAATAMGHLAQVAGRSPPALIGTRFGALVAAATASTHPGTPVVLWDPIVEPERYFRELLRARLMSGMQYGEGRGGPSTSGLEQLRREGSVEALGYQVTRDLYESVDGLHLTRLLGSEPRPILLIEFTRAASLRPELRTMAQDLATRGCEVTCRLFPSDEPWWFARDAVDRSVAMAGPLLATTVRWLEGRAG